MPQSVHPGLRPLTRVLIVALALSPLSLAVPALMKPGTGEEAPFAAAPDPAPLKPRVAGQRLTIGDVRPVVGFAINAHHIEDLSLYLKAVDSIADLGANSVIVLTPMIQPYVDSDGMVFRPDKCATDDQLVAILSHARERGLFTTLLPIVLIEHPGEKDWRGVIKPKDWDEWWSHYDDFIDRFAAIAVKAEVDLLAIGSELNSTEDQVERWRRVAERVRERDGFKGQITYSANWDRYDKITFWSLLDVMCVSSYFELERDNESAHEDDLVRAWAPERDSMLRFARKMEKPVVLSEVGYPSVPWASAHPWNYVTSEGAVADHQAQARCWRAFFRAWTPAFSDPDGEAAGFFGYFWSPYYHGDQWDTTYGIDGKPAFKVVKEGFARIRHAAAPAPSKEQ